MAIDTASPDSEPITQEIIEILPSLTPEHQQLVRQLTLAFAATDSPAISSETPADETEEARRAEQITRNQAAIAWLQAKREAFERATPEEIAEGEAELEDLKRSLNANRAPLPPLFP